MKKYFLKMLPALAALALLFGTQAAPVYADSDAESAESAEATGHGFEDGTDDADESAYEENTDGDDTYVSDSGETFQIPRITDSSERVFDYADLFTDSEEAELRSRIGKLEEKKDADIIILTSDDVPDDADYGTETTQKYAEQFYLDNGFKNDAILFITDMNNRVLWTVGHGKYADRKYVDFEEDVYNAAMNEARNGSYYGAAEAFLTEVDHLDNIAYRVVPTVLSVIISAFLTIIVMIVLIAIHRSSQPSKTNTPAVKADNFRMTRHQVIPRGKTFTRTHIPRDHGDSGGGFSGGTSSGGGFSGGGGGFSGGGGHF